MKKITILVVLVVLISSVPVFAGMTPIPASSYVVVEDQDQMDFMVRITVNAMEKGVCEFEEVMIYLGKKVVIVSARSLGVEVSSTNLDEKRAIAMKSLYEQGMLNL